MDEKLLKVVKLATDKTEIMYLAALLEKAAPLNTLTEVNWPEFPYKPDVNFRIGHTGEHIILRFYVREKAIRAVETRINGEVYKDSCVEFFISFDGAHYYNFEFSCIGTPHIAYGDGRHNRELLPEKTINQIDIFSTLGNQPFDTITGDFIWQLTALIPIDCLIHTYALDLRGLGVIANFYKCGDALPDPHFVTWNPVKTPQPDYHQPGFFGIIEFE